MAQSLPDWGCTDIEHLSKFRLNQSGSGAKVAVQNRNPKPLQNSLLNRLAGTGVCALKGCTHELDTR